MKNIVAKQFFKIEKYAILIIFAFHEKLKTYDIKI